MDETLVDAQLKPYYPLVFCSFVPHALGQAGMGDELVLTPQVVL